MLDAPTERWPRFRLVTYSAPTGIPHEWDAELVEKGAPDGLAYEAAKELTLLEDPGSGPLVCFGTRGISGRLCLDPRTKQIVHISYRAFGRSGPQPKVIGHAHFVNSSLDQFIASVRAVTERFPFDSEVTGKDRRGEEDEETRLDRRFNEWNQAIEELAETLHRIDPAVSTLGCEFWGDFLGAVGMGDYASEYWLNPPAIRRWVRKRHQEA
jgi:hypothetical protein